MQTQAQQKLWEAWSGRKGTEASRMAFEKQRMALWNKPHEEAEMARVFESARSEALAGERNWIKQYELRNKPNPWKMQRTTDEEIRATREEVKALREANKIIQQRQADPTDPMFMNIDRPDMETTPEQWRAHEIMSRLKTAEDKLVEFTTSPDYIQGRLEAEGKVASPAPEPTRPPATPATPQFMRELYPSMGERLEKQPVVAPSPALWQRWLPSQRQQYLGYAEWAGGKPEDILWQATRPLSQPGRGTAWQPFRQRTFV